MTSMQRQLLDGHHRRRIAAHLGVDCPERVVQVDSFDSFTTAWQARQAGHGLAWLGRRGEAWHGRRGVAGHGEAGRGMAGRGTAWQARHGMARRGEAWQARHGRARRGEAGRGGAWHGMAGTAWQE